MYFNLKFFPRWWFSLATVFLLVIFSLLSISYQHSAAHVPEVGGQTLSDPSSTRSILDVQVNYAHDWVAGITDPGEMVSISVEDNLGELKGDALVSADGATGYFFVACEDWDAGWCPDIVPGDHLSASTESESVEINPIGAILIDSLDAAFDTVSGTLDVNGFPGTQLDVTCEIWEVGPTVETQAQADGGDFTCNFDTTWDVQPGDTVAVSYDEPDGDRVTTIVEWPWMRINLSANQVGGNYHAGQNLTITVTDSTDEEKAVSSVTSDWSVGWGGGEGFETQEWDWWPTMPEIMPGYRVQIVADNDYSHTLEAGFIEVEVDAANNEVSGTIIAPPTFTDPLTVECHPWGAWEAGIGDAPVKESWAEPDGSLHFSCQWDPVAEWDMRPGQAVAVMYIEPDGDRIIDVFEQPAPYLWVEKQGLGELTLGGNAYFRIKLWNKGSAPAEGISLTDYLEGLTYIDDTSGYSHTGTGAGPIVWDVGTLEADQTIEFDLFAQVTASVSDIVTNTVTVTTSTADDQGEPWEKAATWVKSVIANDTYLHVSKHALTENPSHDQNMVFVLDVCNQGSTSSSTVTLSDKLDPALSLVNWWAYDAGWTEQSSDSGHLAVTRPTIAGGSCSTVYIRAHVASTAMDGQSLVNTALINAANDLSGDDNQASWEGQVDQPRKNVRIDKEWIRGQLVPSGEIHYLLRYENTGNVPVNSLVLRDTFPVNTTFLGAWMLDPWGRTPFVPTSFNDTSADWQIPSLENGASGEIEVALVIDHDAEPDTLLNNSATIDPLPGETNQNDNASQWSEIIYPALPNLRIHKWHEWLNDGQLLYRIQFENIGSKTVSDVLVTDVLPVDTELDDWQMVEFDPERLVDWGYDGETLYWNFDKLLPGESGWILFHANLIEPITPMDWYTNTVEITIPEDDPSPVDNSAMTVAFSGAEVHSIAFWLNPDGDSSMWGEAIPGSTVIVTTPIDTFNAFADPDCDGCWQIGDVGILTPGDEVKVSIEDGEQSIVTTIPDPFSAAVDYMADEVSGQIGGWSERPVEVHGEWPNGFREILSDPNGEFSAAFLDIPCGASGFVSVVDQVSYAKVSYHLPFAVDGWCIYLPLLLQVD